MSKVNRKRTLIVAVTVSVAVIVLANRDLWVWRKDTPDTIQSAYAAGDLSHALAQAEGGKQGDASILLLAANCYRQFGQSALFQQCVDRARERGENPAVELTVALNKIQHGQLDESPQAMIDTLRSAGASQEDAWSVVVQACHARGQYDEARALLDAWQQQQPDAAQQAYLNAVNLNIRGKSSEAESLLIANIVRHPRHELSWLALAELYSRPPQVRFRQAELVLEHFVPQFPDNYDAPLKLARICRHLGHGASVKPLLAGYPQTGKYLLERAKVAGDQGDYERASDWLLAAGLSTPAAIVGLIDLSFHSTLQGDVDEASNQLKLAQWSTTILSFSGGWNTAQAIFYHAQDRIGRLRHLQDLTARQEIRPTPELQHEIDSTVNLDHAFSRTAVVEEELQSLAGFSLYSQHCSACHGAKGDGRGPGACQLFPPPRNFREEPFRFISTKNNIASDADLERSIRSGLAGTSMPPFDHFSASEIGQLIEVMRWFTERGLRERYRRADESANRGEEEAVWLAARTEPAASLEIPAIDPNATFVARGQALFHSVGCSKCHQASAANELKAEAIRPRLFDSLGRPLLAPNPQRDALHGGSEPQDIYRRIVLGIPGTPHPALSSDSDGVAEALTAYILSLRQGPLEALSNSERSARLPTALRSSD